MRNDFVESAWIGGLIGLLVLLVHLTTANAAPRIQLLALLAAAVVIACGQILFTIWRQRRGSLPGGPSADQATSFLWFRRNQRNPFFRELTSDWTGLDDHLPDDEGVAAPAHAAAGGDSAKAPAEKPAGRNQER